MRTKSACCRGQAVNNQSVRSALTRANRKKMPPDSTVHTAYTNLLHRVSRYPWQLCNTCRQPNQQTILNGVMIAPCRMLRTRTPERKKTVQLPLRMYQAGNTVYAHIRIDTAAMPELETRKHKQQRSHCPVLSSSKSGCRAYTRPFRVSISGRHR